MPFSYFKSTGFQCSGFLNLTPKEALAESNEGAVIVDVREEYMCSYKSFNVYEVIYIPQNELENRYSELPKNKGIILADSVGLKSKEAVKLLLEKGFNNIANMAGGIVEWERDGLPLKINLKEEFSGQCPCQLTAKRK